MDCLVDTNVWLRALAVTHPMKAVARQAIKSLVRDGSQLCIAPRNLVELWNVCTRPVQYNGFGKSAAVTSRYCRLIESFATLLPETPDLFQKWRELVVAHEVSGKQVHDARPSAAMILYGVPSILTFNVQDFVRFKHLEALHPVKVVGAPSGVELQGE